MADAREVARSLVKVVSMAGKIVEDPETLSIHQVIFMCQAEWKQMHLSG